MFYAIQFFNVNRFPSIEHSIDTLIDPTHVVRMWLAAAYSYLISLLQPTSRATDSSNALFYVA